MDTVSEALKDIDEILTIIERKKHECREHTFNPNKFYGSNHLSVECKKCGREFFVQEIFRNTWTWTRLLKVTIYLTHHDLPRIIKA